MKVKVFDCDGDELESLMQEWFNEIGNINIKSITQSHNVIVTIIYF
jgi:hypothetical protein